MVGEAESLGSDVLAERVRVRLRATMIAANITGAVVVFVSSWIVLPAPSNLHHTGRLLAINAVTFALVTVVGLPLGSWWLSGIWRQRLAWADARRAPTERERELTLRYPLSIQRVIAVLWLVAAIIFAVVNAPFSAELSFNVAISIVLGGLVTCSVGYLLGERRLRPITALCLSTGVPEQPQLPGVAARALLSWTLGTGAVLVGLVLVGVGGLHEQRFTAERLSIAIIVLAGLGIVIGLASMVGLARSLADPIEKLRSAVAGVERGQLEHEVAVDDGSEVGLLQAGFNRMLAGLRERERLRDLFGRHVGEDVARHAIDRGAQLGGEAREAAVLFVDIEGSTALAASRDPAEVVSLLNVFFAIVVDVVGANHGWVNKFEGDAALCVFGAPLEDLGAATHALAAARALRDRLAAELPEIGVGIGVSAGRVVAGNIGAAARFEYTVIGDPVNEAARLTELAKTRPGRVLASEAALARADPAETGSWSESDRLTLRGRSGPTAVLAPRRG